MQRDELANMALFVAVAEERSFTKAAAKLGMSQSALSHAMRRLEGNLGLRLFNRTTRSVAPTEAGQRLLDTVGPALADIDTRLSSLTELRDRPAGTVRLSSSTFAARTVLWPAIDKLTAENPDIHVELNVDDGFVDIVSEGYDAGVRSGQSLVKDMIAARIGPPMRMAAVASPAYFRQRGKPKTPHDLAEHTCINLRLIAGGGIYAWEFAKDGRELRVRVNGHLVFNDIDLLSAAAVSGHGIAFVTEGHVAKELKTGALERVLDEWCPSYDGYYLYYPNRRQHSPAFSALLNALRFHG